MAGYAITGDAVWQPGEAHFSAHQFEMTVYRLSAEGYVKVLSFLTTKKYGGDDGARADNAIDAEMPKIRSLLETIHQ